MSTCLAARFDPIGTVPRAAAVAQFPVAASDTWSPTEAVLAGFGNAGREFVAEMSEAYSFSASEAVVLIEAAHLRDRLASLRAVDTSLLDIREIQAHARLELATQGLLAQLLRDLRVRD